MFQTNAILFCYGLTPIQRTVYSYLNPVTAVGTPAQ